jgi:hypothetical protein
VRYIALGMLKRLRKTINSFLGVNPKLFHSSIWGFPFIIEKQKNGEWKPVEDWFEVKLSSCIGKLLSNGDSLTLINYVLTSLPMFLLSYFKITVGVRKRLDYFRSCFLAK